MPACGPLVVRFAPSPTGCMHAGNVFASLMSWLVARRTGGEVVLRIEDLDRGRSRAEYADLAMRDFDFLGLSWDRGPFFQQGRDSAYRQAFDDIARKARVYPCYCTRADLHAASAPHAGEHARYPGTCRNLSPAQLERARAKAQSQDREAAWRLSVPDASFGAVDLFQGAFQMNLSRECGDFVVRRSDATYAYQLAVVVDDAAQGTNCVVRGCDLLSSTPQQMYLQELLGIAHPLYAHVPLLVAPDGRRLSKRHADAGLDSLLQRYETAAGVLGHIAFVAGIIDQDEPASCDDLVREAHLERLRGVRQLTWRP